MLQVLLLPVASTGLDWREQLLDLCSCAEFSSPLTCIDALPDHANRLLRGNARPGLL